MPVSGTGVAPMRQNSIVIALFSSGREARRRRPAWAGAVRQRTLPPAQVPDLPQSLLHWAL
jgi:hypothetical protein